MENFTQQLIIDFFYIIIDQLSLLRILLGKKNELSFLILINTIVSLLRIFQYTICVDVYTILKLFLESTVE